MNGTHLLTHGIFFRTSRKLIHSNHACRSGFTLIEMIVATVLSAVLMAAVLQMIAGVSRDRKTLASLNSARPHNAVTELIRWDLCNAQTISTDAGRQSITLIGLGGVGAKRLSPDGRFVRISYEVRAGNLWRTQEYLDDGATARRTHDLVAQEVQSLVIDANLKSTTPVPDRVRCHLATVNGEFDWIVWTK